MREQDEPMPEHGDWPGRDAGPKYDCGDSRYWLYRMSGHKPTHTGPTIAALP